jgi:1,4-dihydroxy-2-naphthoyl-CoA synthase
MDCPVSRRRAEAVTDLLALEKADGVAVLTLSRPDQLNAYTVAMKDQLVAALDDLDADDEVRAVVVTGRVGRSAPGWTCPVRTRSTPGTTRRAGGTAGVSSRCACSPRPSP